MRRSFLVLLLLAGCASGPMLIPESHLVEMAAMEFEKIKQEMTISDDPEGTAQVARVSMGIAKALGSEMPDAEWEYVLLEDPSANAFAMPGGKIAVFTGLLETVESDDELAAVIGHEIAHVLFRHSNQRMTAEILRSIGAVATVVATDDMDDGDRALVLAAYGIGSQVGVMLPYSRHHESQADQLGLLIAAQSGFDPRAALLFWEKMSESNPKSQPEFFSTHPGYDTRLQNLRDAMPEAMQAYEATRLP